MRHSASHYIAPIVLAAAVTVACSDSASTVISNGVLRAELPGHWEEKVDVRGQWLIASGPISGEKIEVSAICHVDSVDMARGDLERYFVEELRVPLDEVHWQMRGANTVGWTDVTKSNGVAFIRHQLATDGSCFRVAKYSQQHFDPHESSVRASTVLDAARLGRARS
jgi:hypothetical protein